MRSKRKILAGLAALTLFDIASATAAPPPPPMPSWAGYYIGVHAGYRWADGTFNSAPYNFDFGDINSPVSFPGRSETYSLSNAIAGVHGGYNYLFSPTWLIGIEGDVSSGNRSSTLSGGFKVLDSFNDGFAFSRSSVVELTWQATLRGRLGYISGPWMLYGTGGVAFIHAKWSDSSTYFNIVNGNTQNFSTAGSSADTTLTGGVVGVGIEYMFDPRSIVRVEYLYENFGSFAVPHGFGPQIGTLDIGHVSMLRVGISFKISP
jgi:outer membrane immunogenic protein